MNDVLGIHLVPQLRRFHRDTISAYNQIRYNAVGIALFYANRNCTILGLYGILGSIIESHFAFRRDTTHNIIVLRSIFQFIDWQSPNQDRL